MMSAIALSIFAFSSVSSLRMPMPAPFAQDLRIDDVLAHEVEACATRRLQEADFACTASCSVASRRPDIKVGVDLVRSGTA